MISRIYGTERANAQIRQFLTLNGSPAGTIEANTDLSAGAVFSFIPEDGKQAYLDTLVVYIEDTVINSGGYGALPVLAGANGLKIQVNNKSGLAKDFTGGQLVQSNAQWLQYTTFANTNLASLGTGNKAAQFVIDLNSRIKGGGVDERLDIIIKGNFAGLTKHRFFLTGFEI